jgi:hypothetical protein
VDRLQAALAELASADVVALPDQQVRDELLGLLGCLNSVSALVASRLDVFDTRELAELDGFRTATAWLRGFGRLSPGAASGLHKRARVLRALPALRAAALDGAVSAEHVDKVQQLTDRVDLEQIKAYDDILADLCAAAAPAEAQKACERIAAHHDPDGADPDPAADFERRDLSVSRSGSMTYVKARLDAEGGAAFQAVLDAVMRPPAKDDPRSAGQRRADAMIDLCRATLAGGTLSTVQGVRPQIGLLITPEQLAGLTTDATTGATTGAAFGAAFGAAVAAATDPLARVAGPLARAADPLTAAGVPDVDQPWLSWVGQIPNATARRLACDAEFFRIVLDPRNGLPLDVGGAYRIVPPWIRKAVLARDRTCRWPGCDAPHAWLDIHHTMPWEDYHRTQVDELLALCRFHHVRVHECGWTAHFDVTTGQVNVTRPDGRPYELGPSQPWTHPAPKGRESRSHGADPRTGRRSRVREHLKTTGPTRTDRGSDEATGPPGPTCVLLITRPAYVGPYIRSRATMEPGFPAPVAGSSRMWTGAMGRSGVVRAAASMTSALVLAGCMSRAGTVSPDPRPVATVAIGVDLPFAVSGPGRVHGHDAGDGALSRAGRPPGRAVPGGVDQIRQRTGRPRALGRHGMRSQREQATSRPGTRSPSSAPTSPGARRRSCRSSTRRPTARCS